jgi:hypothetical protein
MATDDKKPVPTAAPSTSGTMTPEQEARARAIVEEAKQQSAMDRAYDAAAARSMGTYKEPVKKAKGGMTGSASKRADGCAQRGKTRGRII